MTTARVLTVPLINSLKANTKAYWKYDLHHGNGKLALRISGTPDKTTKTFYFCYTFLNKRNHKISLGRFGTTSGCMTLKDARCRANDMRELLGRGVDPSTHYARHNVAAKISGTTATLGDMLENYINVLNKEKIYNEHHNDNTPYRAKIAIENYVYPYIAHDMPANKIDIKDLQHVLHMHYHWGDPSKNDATRQRRVNKLRAFLQAMYTEAMRHDGLPTLAPSAKRFEIEYNPFAGRIFKLREDSAGVDNRIYSADHLRYFMQHINNDVVELLALKLVVLLGGIRIRPILGATWECIDMQNGVFNVDLTLRKARNNKIARTRPYLLPLTQSAKDVLNEIARYTSKEQHIFSSNVLSVRATKLPFVDDKAVNRRLKLWQAQHVNSGLPVIVPRNLRGSVRTIFEAHHVPDKTQNRILDHGNTETIGDRSYNEHRYLLEMRKVLEKIESIVMV